jgi:hypothetical protein
VDESAEASGSALFPQSSTLWQDMVIVAVYARNKKIMVC